jgi:hypothetical protein
MSPANLVVCAALAVVAVAALATGLWQDAILIGAGCVVGVVSVRRARRPDASDVTRVEAMEYRDERDRAIARAGFAAAGAAAILLSTIETGVAVVLRPGWAIWPAVQSLVLVAAWTAGNRVAARRH